MGAVTGKRKRAACHRCHQKKIRCSGGNLRCFGLPDVNWHDSETPCESCLSVRCDCTYPVKDRNVTVSAAYLNSLRQRVSQPIANNQPPTATSVHALPFTSHETAQLRRDIPASGAALFDNSTTENFVSGLQKLGASEASASTTFPQEVNAERQGDRQTPEHGVFASRYDYFHLNSDELCMNDLSHPAHGWY